MTSKSKGVFNKGFFQLVGINPNDLSLCQRRYTDKLINLVKLFIQDPELSDSVKETVKEFVDMTYGLSISSIRSTFESIKRQIIRDESRWSSRRFLFLVEPNLLEKLRTLYSINLEKYGHDKV